jgi:hypothetical protein
VEPHETANLQKEDSSLSDEAADVALCHAKVVGELLDRK